ncbi:unnamed protein product [Caenorhabditis sp. 36 PRJEB53466]|nr:unnamed protein product [Caenorhabditis sp. 36 PRJEB53466]
MHIQYFPNVPQPSRDARTIIRTHRLGLSGNTLFLFLETADFFEFFAVDVRFPRRWIPVGRMDRQDVSYSFATLSEDARHVYVLFLRLADDVMFGILEFDVFARTETLYTFDTRNDLNRVDEIPLENIKFRSGADGQFVLYDRTILKGEIPFWTLRLNAPEQTFTILKNSIPDNGDHEAEEGNSYSYPIAFDPINRVFAKLMGPRVMSVYTEDRKKWVNYVLPAEHSLEEVFGSIGFPVGDNRVIRETYGSHGHRGGAMQTKLTFHDLDGAVVARVLHNDKLHTTAVVELDHEKQEIRVRKLATFGLDENVSRMFYLIAAPHFHVFLGVRKSAIVFIRSPTLEEKCGWAVQKMLMGDGFEEEVARVSDVNQLKTLAFAKFTEHDEHVLEQLGRVGISDTE